MNHVNRNYLRVALYGTVALSALLAMAAFAQEIESAGEVEELVVTGSSVRVGAVDNPTGPGDYLLTKENWSDVMAGTSALALVKNLPGVTFTSTDAYGLDLSDGFLLVRGFRQNELAITFEGIPLNDGSYGSVTGTAPLNIGVTSNIGSVQISPGSARVSTFSNSGDGGEIRYSLVDVKAKPEFDAVLGYGSNNTIVTGATVQTGQISENGPRVLLGLERISKDKYTGNGTQYSLRADTKIVQDVPWGDFSLFFSYAHFEIWGYNNTSFDMLSKLGWDGTDILYPNYSRAVFINNPANANLSCGAYTCGQLAGLVPYDTGQTTNDYVGNLTHHFRLSDALSGSVMGYAAVSSSDIEIADVSTPSLTGAPFSALVWQTRPQRFGGTATLSYKTENNILSAGGWVETATSTSRFASYDEPLPGQGAPLQAIGPYDTYGGPFQVRNQSAWTTRSLQFYVEDAYMPVDSLTLTAGFKAADFVTSGGGNGPDQAPNGTLAARDPFLPKVSADWRPTDQDTLYLDVAETMIGYRVSSRGNIGPVSSAWAADSQAIFEAAAPTLKPEKDWNFTIGGYHDFGPLSVNLDAYYGIVLNRLLNGTSGPQYAPVRSVGIVPQSQLVGADAIVSAKLPFGFDVSQSVSVSKLRYGDNLDVSGNIVPLKGHYQPGYPGISLITQASFKQDGFEAGVTSAVYLDEPFTYSNDIYVPTYWQVNGHLSYHLQSTDEMPDLVFRLDVNNLLDRHNIGSVGIGGYSVAGDYQTFMRSAPRQMLFTISTKY